MKNMILFSLLNLMPLFAFGITPTKFILEWDTQKLPVSVELSKSYDPTPTRVSEFGILDEKIKLPASYPLKDGVLLLQPKETAVLILKVKNNSNKVLSFSVSPHSTEPGESALGFYFNCLCNGHIYKVGPGQTWYRIMGLNYRTQSPSDEPIVLRHIIFETTSSKSLSTHGH